MLVPPLLPSSPVTSGVAARKMVWAGMLSPEDVVRIAAGRINEVSRWGFLHACWHIDGEHGLVLRTHNGSLQSVEVVGHRDNSPHTEQAISNDVGDGVTQATRVGTSKGTQAFGPHFMMTSVAHPLRRPKWTRFAANFPEIAVLCQQCDGQHDHLPWRLVYTASGTVPKQGRCGIFHSDHDATLMTQGPNQGHPGIMAIGLINASLVEAGQVG